MKAGFEGRAYSPWRHWYRRVLPAYWVYLFCITHFPGLQVRMGSLPIDKVLHALFFGLLAFLFWRFAETFRKPAPGWLALVALVWIGAYAAADEWTQDYFRRGTDPEDWVADMVGVAAVLGVLEWRRRVNARHMAAAVGEQAVDSTARAR